MNTLIDIQASTVTFTTTTHEHVRTRVRLSFHPAACPRPRRSAEYHQSSFGKTDVTTTLGRRTVTIRPYAQSVSLLRGWA